MFTLSVPFFQEVKLAYFPSAISKCHIYAFDVCICLMSWQLMVLAHKVYKLTCIFSLHRVLPQELLPNLCDHH